MPIGVESGATGCELVTDNLQNKSSTDNLRSSGPGKKLGVVPNKDLHAVLCRILLRIAIWWCSSEVSHDNLSQCRNSWERAWTVRFAILSKTGTTNHPALTNLPHLSAKIVSLSIDCSDNKIIIQLDKIIDLFLQKTEQKSSNHKHLE